MKHAAVKNRNMDRKNGYGECRVSVFPFPSGMRATILAVAREIAISHHEKWNSTGYPEWTVV
jgi:response regulator RpfG family c-di-GMP phosphodiesterase